MQALYHSPFLQALGYAIANSFWQVALLWLLVIVLNGVIKPSAAGRYRIALTGQVTGFAWFIVTFRFYLNRCLQAAEEIQALQVPDSTSFYISYPDVSVRSGFVHWLLKAEQLLPFLSVAYLLLLAFLAVKWAIGYRKAQQIRHSGLEKIGAEWRVFVQKAALQLNIKAAVKIYLSSFIKSPLTVGFLKPVILIPVASINHLSTEQLEAVILHELAHIKRADYLVNLLQIVIEITLFFNPFTRLLSTLIRKERENSCDDWVLQFQYNPAMYAEALLSIAWLQQQPAFAMPAAGGDKGELLPRVKRMLGKQESAFNYKRHAAALLLMTTLLSVAGWLSPVNKNNTPVVDVADVSKRTVVQPLVVEPVSAAVSNPLFSPVFFLAKSNTSRKDATLSKRDVLVKRTEKKMTDTAAAAVVSAVAVRELQAQPVAVGNDNPVITLTVATPENRKVNMFIETHMVRSNRHIVTGKEHRRMQFTQVFAAYMPVKTHVRPPRLIEEPDTITVNRHFSREKLLLMPPPPDAPRRTPPSAAIVLERLLQSGNDSLDQVVLTSIAQAKNTADSVTVLRQIYKELWQQARQRRQQVEALSEMHEKAHWAFSKPVFVENEGNTAVFTTRFTDSTATVSAVKQTMDSTKPVTIVITNYATAASFKYRFTERDSIKARQRKPVTEIKE